MSHVPHQSNPCSFIRAPPEKTDRAQVSKPAALSQRLTPSALQRFQRQRLTMSRSPSPSDARNVAADEHQSLVRRSLHAVFSPFSPAALALLPRLARPARYTRADDIPETQPNSEGQQPTIRDYHSINLPPQVRVPKKLPTPIRVEGKVWFANERSTYGLHLQSDIPFFFTTPCLAAWVSWMNIAILLATLSLALYNGSKDAIATSFAYVYAAISICTLVCFPSLFKNYPSHIIW